jgi:8-oxo-dGTP pyrophosphatase MutT (NUDIX family)
VKLDLANRLRLALDAPDKAPQLQGDLPHLREQASAAAAVLIAVTNRREPGVIFTVRREHLRRHAGQIALPGGRAEPGESAVEAALRESFEELGLEPAEVEVVGELGEYRTVTGYVITPVVAVIPSDLPLQPHQDEVASWFEAPLGYVLDPANQRLESAVFGGRERHYWVIEWQGNRIWGATAAILVNLARRLQWNA